MGVAYFKYYYHHTSSSSSSYLYTVHYNRITLLKPRGWIKELFFFFIQHESDFLWTTYTGHNGHRFLFLRGMVLMGFVWCVIKNGFLDHWIMRVKINSAWGLKMRKGFSKRIWCQLGIAIRWTLSGGIWLSNLSSN